MRPTPTSASSSRASRSSSAPGSTAFKVRRVDLVEATTTVDVRYELASRARHASSAHGRRRRRGRTGCGMTARLARRAPRRPGVPSSTWPTLDAAAAPGPGATASTSSRSPPRRAWSWPGSRTARGCSTIDGRRAFRYESVYFDTPDRRSYTRRPPADGRTASRSGPGPTSTSGVSMVEVKIRDRAATRSRTGGHPFAPERRWDLDGAARLRRRDRAGAGHRRWHSAVPRDPLPAGRRSFSSPTAHG